MNKKLILALMLASGMAFAQTGSCWLADTPDQQQPSQSTSPTTSPSTTSPSTDQSTQPSPSTQPAPDQSTQSPASPAISRLH